MDNDPRMVELRALKERIAALEAQSPPEPGVPAWPPRTYYATYHLLAGMVLGLISAAASLLLNIIGAMMLGKHPLQLIRVYLTFPLGEKALTLDAAHDGFILAAGCCLYLATGMIGGIPFHLILSRYFDRAALGTRFLVATVLGLGVWIVNFYGVLYWLQPLLIGDRWIVREVPILVAVLTHLVFGWTMLLVDHWGRFTPGTPATREANT